MSPAEYITPDGEVVTTAELAERWADLSDERRRAERELRRLNDQVNDLRDAMRDLGAMLLEGMAPGDLVRLPDGREVACVHGKRRNSTLDRAACDGVLEVLEDHGLAERVEPPPPPPVIRYPTVSALRAAEVDLARAGVRVADLIREGGPGDPDLTLVEGER